jgi:hypothetical protein
MTSIITNSQVFEFMGTSAAIATDQGTMMTNLIAREQPQLESELGRKISSTAFTNVLFSNWLNCEIFGQELVLKGIYRDIYSITELKENGSELTAIADYNDGNDYFLDTGKGYLVRKNQDWSPQQFAIKISGKLGLVNQANDEALPEIQQILIELCAAKSGLWKTNVNTEGGTVEAIRTDITDQAKEQFKKYKLRF